MFPFPHHDNTPQQKPIPAATGCLMPAIHHCRQRCSHSHNVYTGAVTVTLPLQLQGGVLIVILAIIDHWCRSSFIPPFTHLVGMWSADPLVSVSCHVPVVQLIVMMSASTSSSASHLTSTSPGILLVPSAPPPPPLVASLLFLGLRLLLCLCL